MNNSVLKLKPKTYIFFNDYKLDKAKLNIKLMKPKQIKL